MSPASESINDRLLVACALSSPVGRTRFSPRADHASAISEISNPIARTKSVKSATPLSSTRVPIILARRACACAAMISPNSVARSRLRLAASGSVLIGCSFVLAWALRPSTAFWMACARWESSPRP